MKYAGLAVGLVVFALVGFGQAIADAMDDLPAWANGSVLFELTGLGGPWALRLVAGFVVGLSAAAVTQALLHRAVVV